ncbi:hypothetical protein BP6252_09598 [Coleophoma cylindrospora]|uniref:Zn(2)-C6 fungal-type domain-containing protein n=1 Tax=Coleophoma cylindrospora TaxID=1849047 RepID=A0A3D8QVT4_9HELO|nr:hypothetical protein BP6252_09598 [Coleophoma cylindrospora]
MASHIRVRRRTLSCARCRLRKVMCDALSPTCSRCKKANVSCVAFNPATKQGAPRSIAQYLETEIANRDRSISSLDHRSGRDEALKVTATLPASKPSLLESVVNDFTPSFIGVTAAVPLARCVVVGTRIPSTRLFGATDIDMHHPRSIINPLPMYTPLESIPIEASRYLFDNYMLRVAAQYPIFYSQDVISSYSAVFQSVSENSSSGSTSYDIYIISLIMAISLTTAARTQQGRANSIASGLFKNAIRHIQTVLTNDIRGLQALLLLLQYAFLDPGAANIWLLSGFASQACIDLGLHQELPESAKVSILERDMRRRVFWCAYEMEIAVCAALFRPTSLLSKNINVSFPTEIEDSAISAENIDSRGRPSKFTSHRIWRFRQIECEIVSVLFHSEEITARDSSLEGWMNRMEQAIYNWNDEVHRSAALNQDPSMNSTWAEMDLYAHIATPYTIVTLFRPCPRTKKPSSQNLMKAFVAAVKVADGYFKQANLDFGNSKYVFHPCHHTFSSAVAFLQALQRCKDCVCVLYTLSEVEAFMRSFSQLFATMAERWPAAERCLEEYERLLTPVKKDYLEFISQRARSQSISHVPDDFVDLVTLQDDVLDQTTNLDSMFNFGSFFHLEGSSAVEEYNSLYPPVPINWNAEFHFDISQ